MGVGAQAGAVRSARMILRPGVTSKRRIERPASIRGKTDCNIIVSSKLENAVENCCRHEIIALAREDETRFLEALTNLLPTSRSVAASRLTRCTKPDFGPVEPERPGFGPNGAGFPRRFQPEDRGAAPKRYDPRPDKPCCTGDPDRQGFVEVNQDIAGLVKNADNNPHKVLFRCQQFIGIRGGLEAGR